MKKISNLISNLQTKSDEQKTTIAFVSSAVITGIIFIVWLTATISNDFMKKSESEVQSASSPIESTKNMLKNIFQGKTETYDLN